MVRRVGAVAAGVFACQMAMLVCLALAVGLLLALPDWPVLVLTGAAVLLVLPGLIGGGLAGVVSPSGAIWQGALVGLLFGLSVLLVKLFIAPSFGYYAAEYDLVVYPALTAGLAACGALGGGLARRRHPGGVRMPERTVGSAVAGPGQ